MAGGTRRRTRNAWAVVGEMRDATRWRMVVDGQGRRGYSYLETDGMERARYRTARSPLMEEVMKEEEEVDEEHMLGLFASRRYDVDEPITVYIGDDLGEEGGNGDVELARRVAAGGGRHVMSQGKRLIDGKYGPTGAQYINSAYRAPKAWVNNARMLASGTIVATKVIIPDAEILMAYGAAYWRRWGKRRPRGSPQTVTDRATAGGNGAGVQGGAASTAAEGDQTATTTTSSSARRRHRRRERLEQDDELHGGGDQGDPHASRRVTRRMTTVARESGLAERDGVG